MSMKGASLAAAGVRALMTKLRLYNGEEVVEKGRTKKIDTCRNSRKMPSGRA
jgi:hypothetical protein